MDQNQAVNRGGATEFFQAWKNKENNSCCENKGPKITLCIPQKFLGEQQTLYMYHVTHFRPLVAILHMNECLRAIYCNPKSHIQQHWLFADIILKTRSKFLTSPFFSLTSTGGDTLCVSCAENIFAQVNWSVAQVATQQLSDNVLNFK